MEKRYSILIIHFYFGKLSSFFDLFLKSCEDNESIDFLIVTDCEIKTDSPNILVHKTTFEETKHRIEDVLGFKIGMKRVHKLCDFKPLYGAIMLDYAKNYDFWGFCDSDLIFGDIRTFLTDEVLNKYNHILGLGHFQLQRFDDPQYELVLKSARGVGRNAYYEPDFDASKFMENDNGPQWEEVFRTENNYIFDELPYGVAAYYYRMFPDHFWSGFTAAARCFDDVDPNPLYYRDIFNYYNGYLTASYAKLAYIFPFYNRISLDKDEIDAVIYEKEKSNLYRIGVTADGRIIKSECLYVHFLHRKIRVKTSSRSRYLIVPNSVIDYETISANRIKRWSNTPMLKIERIVQRFMFQINRSKNIWKKIKKAVTESQ